MADATTPETPEAPNPLLGILKDIELPEPIGWWPPAPGWWILAALTILIALWIAKTLVARHRAGAYRREATATLALSHEQFRQDGDAGTYLQGVNTLLRRLSIHLDGRENVARLTGERWIAHLNSVTSNPLPIASAQMLETGLYKKHSDIRVDEIHPAIVALVDGLITTDRDRTDA